MGKNPGKVIVSEDLLKIKDMIGRPRKIKTRDSEKEVLTQLKEMGYKIETMENKGEKPKGKSIAPKKKKQILFLLKENKMTSSQLGEAMNMSRSRANEYLKFMESEGILTSMKKGRKKFYMLKEVVE